MGAGGLGLPSRPGSSKAPALTTEVIFANPFTWSFVTQLFKIVAFRVTSILSTVGVSPVTSAAQLGVHGRLLPASGVVHCPAYPTLLLTLMVSSSKPPHRRLGAPEPGCVTAAGI